MTLRIDSKKWILYRHSNNFNLLCSIAEFLKSYSKTTISKREKTRLNLKLKEVGLYNERNLEMPLDAINHKINQLSYYMFGYQTKINGEDRFMYSPLGNLFLKNIENKVKSSKIFLAMVWAVQFQHPHSGTNKAFQLYPFRLIFKLLTDRRINNKLYAFEVSYIVVFIQEVNKVIYEQLIQEILELRELTNNELTEKFQSDRHAYVNSSYEWDYYVSKLFEEAGILTKTNGELICKLQHGNTPTFRKITRNVVEIPTELMRLVKDLESEYSYLSNPLLLNDSERLKIDVIKEVYSWFYRFFNG